MNKGSHHKPEAIAKNRDWRFGRKLSPEHVAKIVAAPNSGKFKRGHKGYKGQLGRRFSEEHRKKLSLWQLGLLPRKMKKEYRTDVPKSQSCDICQQLASELKKGLAFDHDHKTGKFRGWLCFPCNSALGLAKDNIEILLAMVEYLKKSREDAIRDTVSE